MSRAFWVKKELMAGQIILKNKHTCSNYSVFVSSPQPIHDTEDWIGSFYIDLFKSRNYWNYVHVYTHFIHVSH